MLAVALGTAMSSACAAEAIQGTYSREYRCPERNVFVEELGGDRYRASGCGREVVYQCIASHCIPDRTELVDNDARHPARTSARAAPATWSADRVGVARREKARGRSLVALDLSLDHYATLKLRASPADIGEVVQLKLAHTQPEDQLEDCALESLVNGRRTSLPKAIHDWSDGVSSLRVNLDRAAVEQLGGARRFALKACDLKWTLDEEQLEQLRRFVGLYVEELAWATDAQGGADALKPPTTGWPLWNVAGLSVPSASSSKPLEGPALFKLIAPSVYEVESQGDSRSSFGSAVAVSETQLLTNCHVVQGSRRIIVKQKGSEWIGKLSRSDAASDRCVLTCDAKLNPVRGLRSQSELAVGEAAFTLGAPNGLELSLAAGIISGLRDEGGRRYVQTTAPISPGSSGGGLFDARGNLVGITTAVLLGRERLNQSLNFAIPAEAFFQP